MHAGVVAVDRMNGLEPTPEVAEWLQMWSPGAVDLDVVVVHGAGRPNLSAFEIAEVPGEVQTSVLNQCCWMRHPSGPCGLLQGEWLGARAGDAAGSSGKRTIGD